MASEQQRARQLALAASAAIGDEPGIQVSAQDTESGFRVVIQACVGARPVDYERGYDRMRQCGLRTAHYAEALYVPREEWRNLLECALDEVAKREEDAANTAEHTTANLPRPSVFAACGTRIKRTYDGIGEVSSVATVPNSRLPPPMLHLMPAFRAPNAPERVEGEQAQPHRVPELVLVAGVDGLPVAVLPREGNG